jgi:hypothetical protein
MGGGPPKRSHKAPARHKFQRHKVSSSYLKEMAVLLGALAVAGLYAFALTTSTLGWLVTEFFEAASMAGGPSVSETFAAEVSQLGWGMFVLKGPFVFLLELVNQSPVTAFFCAAISLAACVQASRNIYRDHMGWLLLPEKERSE